MILEIVEKIAEEIKKNQDYLTDLDRKIGDGDHGVNLARGFTEIQAQLESYQNLPLSEVFQKMGMTLLTKVGGASGAIYGTAFMSAGMHLKGKEDLEEETIVTTLKSMIDGIQKRGKAVLGEKTMLDTILPVYDKMEMLFSKGKHFSEMKTELLAVAEKGMESTKPLIATKGRATYLGERARGHLDPGAVSSYLMIKVICESKELGG